MGYAALYDFNIDTHGTDNILKGYNSGGTEKSKDAQHVNTHLYSVEERSAQLSNDYQFKA
jgi:hypothetical protein